MRTCSREDWGGGLWRSRKRYPLVGHVELTYRCQLRCAHCFCRGLEDQNKELTTTQFKKTFDDLQQEGCLLLNFSGGDPLLREDFLELYVYAWRLGFMVSVLTNGLGITPEIIKQFKKFPPKAIEITLNGITPGTYEAVTGGRGALDRVVANIKLLVKHGFFVRVKTIHLRENRHEVARIRRWVKKTIGSRGHFMDDFSVLPRMNGDRSSLDHRIPVQALVRSICQHKPELRRFEKILFSSLPEAQKDGLRYQCSSCIKRFTISPYGQLRFCPYYYDQCVDLKKTSFHEGFYKHLPRMFKARYTAPSKCRDCSLKFVCLNCPAKAFLETGNKEGHVDYYCAVAREIAQKVLPTAINMVMSRK